MVATAVEPKSQLQAIGIEVMVEQMDNAARVEATGVGSPPDIIKDYEHATTNFTFYPGPDTYVGDSLPERNATVWGQNEVMENSKITQLLDKAEGTQDHEGRRKEYLMAQLRLMDMVSALWLVVVNQIDGVSNKLRNYKQSFTGRRFLINQAWLA